MTGANLATFWDVARTAPGRIILAHSEDELHTGVPLSEIYRPPYRLTYLAVGIVLMGTSAVSGDANWFTVGQELTAIARTVGLQSDGKRFVNVTKDMRPLKFFIPKQGVSFAPDVVELREY